MLLFSALSEIYAVWTKLRFFWIPSVFLFFGVFMFFQHLCTLLDPILSHFQSEPCLPGMEEQIFQRHQVRPPFFFSTLPLLSGGRDFASTGTVMAIRIHEEHLEGQNDRVG